MRTREEINKDIEELEYKYNKSRNVVDRARYCAQIKEFKLELEKVDAVEMEKKIVHQNVKNCIFMKKRTVENGASLLAG